MFEFKLRWNYKGQRGGDTLFRNHIGNWQTALRDWSPAFRTMVADVLEPGVREQFDTAGHGTWAQLLPSTVSSKRGNQMILSDTRRLMNSFVTGQPDNVMEITRSSLHWGSRVPYALFHQTGTGSGFQQTVKPARGRGVPMRKIMEFQKRHRVEVKSILVGHLATIARREGFAIGKGLGLDPLAARKLGEQLLGL